MERVHEEEQLVCLLTLYFKGNKQYGNFQHNLFKKYIPMKIIELVYLNQYQP